MQLVRDSLNSVRRFLHSSKSQRDAVDTLETSIASLMHRLMSAPSPSSSSLSSPDSSNHFPPRPLTSHSTPISHHPPHATGDVILTPNNASLRPDVGHTSTPARSNLSVPGESLDFNSFCYVCFETSKDVVVIFRICSDPSIVLLFINKTSLLHRSKRLAVRLHHPQTVKPTIIAIIIVVQ